MWALHDPGLPEPDNDDFIIPADILSLWVVLGVGLARSHACRQLSGQLDVDDLQD